MYKKIISILILILFFHFFANAQENLATNRRTEWLKYLDKLARPVLENLSNDKLKANLVLSLSPMVDNKEQRTKAAYLEAFARTLSGIAPWLQLEEGDTFEKNIRTQFRNFAIKSLSNAVNPNAKDYMQFSGGQALVDASFLSLALVRCPWLWQNSDSATKQNVINALLISRNTIPVYSNWLFFSAMVESFFCKYNLPYDKLRIDFAIKEFTNHWYVGDGMYSDGNHFHLDYYNSYVIQPYMQCIISIINKKDSTYKSLINTQDKIYKRYAIIQERMINTDGSFAVLGRSIAYRGGAFHHLSNCVLQHNLPENLLPAQVRCALTAVIKKTFDAKNTFTENGWLNIGLCGNQPNLAEGYINTGSLYLCSQIFLPLGLSPNDNFWENPDAAYTSQKIWNGENVNADHAMDLDK